MTPEQYVWLTIGIIIIVMAVLLIKRNGESDDDDTIDDHPSCEWCGQWEPGQRPRCPREYAMQQAYVRHMKAAGGLVPHEALKETSDKFRRKNFVSIYNPGTTYSNDVDNGYDTQTYDLNDEISFARFGGRRRKALASHGNFTNGIASVDPHDVYVPAAREVNLRWDKVGYVSTANQTDDALMFLLRRPINEYQDSWQYKVVDKHGFDITLQGQNAYLEDGDKISAIPGKESKGDWIVHLDAKNKWVYF